jgi:hypothetical protein
VTGTITAPPRYDGGVVQALRIEEARAIAAAERCGRDERAMVDCLGIGRRRRDAPRAAPGLILPDSIDLAAFARS